MNLSKAKTKVLFLTHYTFFSDKGEDTDRRIIRFLKDKVKKVVLITNPLADFDNRVSYCTIFKNGEKFKTLKVTGLKGSLILKYLSHIFIIYYFLFRSGLNYDLCIACNNLSFITIFPLRLVGFIKRAIYYSIDFSPQRFLNHFLDRLYHFMNKFANKYSDVNWVMTKEQIRESKKYGITSLNGAPFDIVPICYDIQNINVQPLKKIDFYNILYMGAIRESMGPQLAIQVMPYLIKKFPKIHLTIIGGGKYLDYLKKLVKKLKIADYVDFTGYIDSFKQMTNLMVQKSIGLAPYMPTPGSFSYFSDPSKIKLYMCCGLPVITTDVVTMASLISKSKSGIIIDYSEKSLVSAITFLLENKDRYKAYKEAAVKLSEKFDVKSILGNAFKSIPDVIQTRH